MPSPRIATSEIVSSVGTTEELEGAALRELELELGLALALSQLLGRLLDMCDGDVESAKRVIRLLTARDPGRAL